MQLYDYLGAKISDYFVSVKDFGAKVMALQMMQLRFNRLLIRLKQQVVSFTFRMAHI